jgi:hypothetical protein
MVASRLSELFELGDVYHSIPPVHQSRLEKRDQE